MCEMRIALTNLGMYNEGTLNYIWLDLPATAEEIEAAKNEININECYEEKSIPRSIGFRSVSQLHKR